MQDGLLSQAMSMLETPSYNYNGPAQQYYSPYYNQATGNDGTHPLQSFMEKKFSELGRKIDQIHNQQKVTDGKIAGLQTSLQGLSQRQNNAETNIEKVQDSVNELRRENDYMRQQVEQLRRSSVQQNIRVFNYPGLDETKTEHDLKIDFLSYLRAKLNLTLEVQEINKVYIAGRRTAKKHLVVEFVWWATKMAVFKNLKNLQTTEPDAKVSFQDDLTHAELQNKKVNLPLLAEARKILTVNDKINLRRGSIFINGKKQSPEDLNKLKAAIRRNAATPNLNTGSAQQNNPTTQTSQTMDTSGSTTATSTPVHPP